MSIPSVTPHTIAVPPGPAQHKTVEGISAAQHRPSPTATFIQGDELSLGIKDQPLSLLLKAAIEKLNERLAPELGENAIQNVAASGLDFSPEATAERIVSLSTGFFEAFKAQHEDEDEAVVFDQFMEVIGGGIEQGFAEAQEILDGLGVLQGDIANNIDQTYDRVQEGLQAFRAQFSLDE